VNDLKGKEMKMKKVAVIMTVLLIMVAGGNALADSLNPHLTRPAEINTTAVGENSLQQELDAIYGIGVVDAATDQLDIGMFSVALLGSNLIAPQLKFEWTANKLTQNIGIFGWDGTKAVTAQIFSGAQTAESTANVQWLTASSGVISTFDKGVLVSSLEFENISKEFFGFYFQANNTAEKYYSVDSLNENGTARVLGYMPNLSGAVFSYEDGSDFDYQDAGFLVESIITVPEPSILLLLGFGLVGLAGIRNKFGK